jgi:hypothetical protein
VLIAANRDENPSRPSDPPRVLLDRPRVTGGRDRIAGGTWLAIRERRAAIAMLNRRVGRRPGEAARLEELGAARGAGTSARAVHPRVGGARDAAPDPALRSRGLLTLEVASVAPEGPVGARALAYAALERALSALTEARYAPFSLAFLSPESCWVLTHGTTDAPGIEQVPPGWHVLTHTDLDDPGEPRVAWLLRDLSGWTPQSLDEGERGLLRRLATHGGAARAAGEAAKPVVCIHEGPMVTVSSSIVCLTRGEARYRHLEGRPCEGPLSDCSALLSGELTSMERS